MRKSFVAAVAGVWLEAMLGESALAQAPDPSAPPPAAAPLQEQPPAEAPQPVVPDQPVPQQQQVPPGQEALGFPERAEAPGFEQEPTGEPDFNQQPVPEAGLGESESISPGDPASLVREKFPELADQVEIEVSPEGVVELTGEVPRLADKLAMGETASEAQGSGLIVNRLDVKAPRRNDQAITREVRRKLRADEFLRDYKIDVLTREQRVYLRGEVPSFIAVEEALRQAAEVRGVRDVIVSGLEMPLP